MTSAGFPDRPPGPHFSPLLPHDAVAPDIFDAVALPGVLLPLVLANLLSPRLWDLAAAAQQQSAAEPRSDPADGVAPQVRAVQESIDRHYQHLSPPEVARLDGDLDLARERDRLGAEVVDYALSRILATARWRMEHGTLADPALVESVAAGRFPAYFYATIDEAHAHRIILGRRKHKPAGLTSCLDEAALFAAALLAMPGVCDSFAVLGGPSHYTVLGTSGGRPWWFYGKSHLWSAGQWQEQVARDHDGDAQAALDALLPDLDCIITPAGTLDLAGGRTTIPVAEQAQLLATCEQYFGRGVRQLAAAHSATPHADGGGLAALATAMADSGSRDGAEHVVRDAFSLDPQRTDVNCVLMAHRSLQVADAGQYLDAARNSPRARRLARELRTPAEALAAVAAIPGDASMFGDPARIAMPEETLRLGTGSDRDKALLLHVLAELLPGTGGQRPDPGIETVLGSVDSVVTGPGFSFSTLAMAPAPAPRDGIRLRAPLPHR